jgi:hypothetical protein
MMERTIGVFLPFHILEVVPHLVSSRVLSILPLTD